MRYTESMHFVITKFSLFRFLWVSCTPGPVIDVTGKLGQ